MFTVRHKILIRGLSEGVTKSSCTGIGEKFTVECCHRYISILPSN